MRSSRSLRHCVTVATSLALMLEASVAWPQQPAHGFDLERLYTSAPGGGWFVMDSLAMQGGLGGAVSLVTSYAHNPLQVTDGSQHLAVVSDEAFVQLGLAATYDRFRLYVTFDSPLSVQGNSGTVGGYAFTGPRVDPATAPDAITRGRVGFDARLFGTPMGPVRLGLGGQVVFPGGAPGALRDNYLSDGPPSTSWGAYNAMVRGLFAGDVGWVTYAGHIGLNLRGLDDPTAPGGPRGSELLFGGAVGARLSTCGSCDLHVTVGPEVFGATALQSAFGTATTALEGLLTGRLEGHGDGPRLRLKLGVGAGINPHFGAPEQRVVVGLELFDHATK